MSETPPTPQITSYSEGEHPAALCGDHRADDVETVVGSRSESEKISALAKVTKRAEVLAAAHQRLQSGDLSENFDQLSLATLDVMQELRDLTC